MNGKHTPGPWKTWPSIHSGRTYVVLNTYKDGDRGYIATAITEEDAQLIAAAPELLEALKAAMAFIESHVADPDITDEMCDKYAALQKLNPDAVINKAEGRS
jgi:hypothetical protein